jgi:hypothetical protein
VTVDRLDVFGAEPCGLPYRVSFANMNAMAKRFAEGVHLLRAFLKAHGILPVRMAEALDVTRSTGHEWLAGSKRPRAHHRRAIAVWTGGAVPVTSWEYDSERAAAEDVRPYAPPSKTGTDDR